MRVRALTWQGREGVPLEQAPRADDVVRRTADGCITVVLDPAA